MWHSWLDLGCGSAAPINAQVVRRWARQHVEDSQGALRVKCGRSTESYSVGWWRDSLAEALCRRPLPGLHGGCGRWPEDGPSHPFAGAQESSGSDGEGQHAVGSGEQELESAESSAVSAGSPGKASAYIRAWPCLNFGLQTRSEFPPLPRLLDTSFVAPFGAKSVAQSTI